jgi:alcohol dehydrogenase (cytochrome c)
MSLPRISARLTAVLAVAGAVALAAPAGVLAQTTQQLVNATRTPGDVLINGMTYDAQRFSRLTQINRSNVGRLVPVWNVALTNNLGEESQALAWNGSVYITNHRATYAIDAKTGKVRWKNELEFDAEVPRVVCCGQVNRGAAIYEGRLFRGTLDAHVQALDARTGRELWKTRLIEWRDGYSVTGAPLVANGVLISGMAGGEYGTRGFLVGLDPETGRELWRTHTIPGVGEPGNETWPGDLWKRGGGATWGAGSYDPQLDMVYWGTGNAGPWNGGVRKGDNKNAASTIAIRPKTGEMVWAWQNTPGDPFDFDSISQPVLGDLTIEGKPRKVVMHADKNGYFYVLDRATGKPIVVNPFVKVTWSTGLDENFRPIWSESTRKLIDTGAEVESWPAITGGKNWNPMAYNPETRLIYANTQEGGMTIRHTPVEYKQQGSRYIGVAIKRLWPEDGNRGALRAIDPLTGKTRWKVPYAVPSYATTMTTAGKLVFSGDMLGEFSAYDAEKGTKLWSFQTGSGIIGQPISWELDGVQYITVPSGLGGVYVLNSGDERLSNVPAGGSLWTFALFRK